MWSGRKAMFEDDRNADPGICEENGGNSSVSLSMDEIADILAEIRF